MKLILKNETLLISYRSKKAQKVDIFCRRFYCYNEEEEEEGGWEEEKYIFLVRIRFSLSANLTVYILYRAGDERKTISKIQ